MKIKDIDNLEKKGDMYDLTQNLFEYNNSIQYLNYKVQKGEEMRIDLVCYSIYGNVDNVDIILNVNNISNPLNIKEGVIIKYPNPSDIDLLRISKNSTNQIGPILSNPNKSIRLDKSRQNYLENNYSLPPTSLERPISQTKISDGTIVLGDDLFNK